MELTLTRTTFRPGCTLGVLAIDNVYECFTLEDAVHGGPKVPGETAIPAGRYEVALTWSNRFQESLPLLLDVPGFTGIRIHAGNTAADTAGCILVGQGRHGDAITRSRAALEALLLKLGRALADGDCWLTIVGAPA